MIKVEWNENDWERREDAWTAVMNEVLKLKDKHDKHKEILIIKDEKGDVIFPNLIKGQFHILIDDGWKELNQVIMVKPK